MGLGALQGSIPYPTATAKPAVKQKGAIVATYKETAAILGGATQTVWEETAPDVFFTVYQDEGIKVRFSPEYGDWTITSTATYPHIRMNIGDVVAAVQEIIRTVSATV